MHRPIFDSRALALHSHSCATGAPLESAGKTPVIMMNTGYSSVGTGLAEHCK